MTDARRFFLQGMILQPVLRYEEARTLYKRAVEAFPPTEVGADGSLDALLRGANLLLEEVEMRVVEVTDEAGERIVVLVNENDDELAQLATDYEPKQIEFIKKIIELIVSAPQSAFECSSITLVNASTLTRVEAETLIHDLVRTFWLHKDGRGFISLGCRTTAELKRFLKDEYQDQIHDCSLCHEPVYRGETCVSEECQARLHARCRFRRFRTVEPKCLVCQTAWPNQEPVALAEETSAASSSSRSTSRSEASSSNGSQAGSSSRRPAPEEPESGRATRRSRRSDA